MRHDWTRTIRGWLIEENRFEEEIPAADVKGSRVHFAYSFSTQGLRHVAYQPYEEEKVILQSTVILDPPHQDLLFKTMSDVQRTRFLWDLRMGLLWKETSFQMEPSAESLRQFVFTRVLHGDALNKATFEEAISELHRANLFVIWNLRREDELAQLEKSI